MKLSTKIFALILAGFVSINAHAQTTPDIAEQPCDTEYWRQMSAKAWMEAEREIMQNQNLIFKADSVLEYTCFDQFVNIAAHEGGDIFVHTTYFGEEIIKRGSPQSMEKSLDAVVYASLGPYIANSFGHKFLGGRAEHMTIANQDHILQSPVAKLTGGYACAEMANVWQAAKCANFIDDAAFESTDGFYPFEGIKGHNGTADVAGYDTLKETRQLPMTCGTGDNLGPAGAWTDQIALANNDAEAYLFQTPLATVYEEVGDKLEPGNCGQPAIATGVTVYKQGHQAQDGGASHLDGVCTNPGCHYEKGTLTTVGTCVTN